MTFIKNFDQLASTPQRKVVLQLIEAALASIKPDIVLNKNFAFQSTTLRIQEKTFDLKNFEHVYLIGFGKGSADICKLIEQMLGEKLTEGYDIDVIDETFAKIHYTKGTHPLPSEENIAYTNTVVDRFSGKTTEKDLVLIVVCGGGSVLFEKPYKINLETLTTINKALLRSGASISEMNVIRKHLSSTKGGGFAKMLHPATVACLLFSDVPGNDLSVIASGPTVKDPTTLADVKTIMEKYNIAEQISLHQDDFVETPKEDTYFENVSNLMVLSNQTSLTAMQEKAKELGYNAFIYSDRLEGNAEDVAQTILNASESGKILLAGGETTVKVTGNGKGGRNQELVLSSLPHLTDDMILASFDSDGWDFYMLAGAIADKNTVEKAKQRNIDWKKYLVEHNSYEFWENIADGILTGKLESNVSDLMIVARI